MGDLPIVAENLGVITPDVEALRKQFGFPGMAILQFAFGNDPQAPDFKPHNYPHHLVAYTGTHDNDTVVGWWNSKAGAGSIRTAADVEKEMAYARRYLNSDGHQINWDMIRTLMASVADTVLFPYAGCAWCRQRRPDELARQFVGQLALALSRRPADPTDCGAPEGICRNLRTVALGVEICSSSS